MSLETLKESATAEVETLGHRLRGWHSDGDVQAVASCHNEGCEGAVRVKAEGEVIEGMCVVMSCPAKRDHVKNLPGKHLARAVGR